MLWVVLAGGVAWFGLRRVLIGRWWHVWALAVLVGVGSREVSAQSHIYGTYEAAATMYIEVYDAGAGYQDTWVSLERVATNQWATRMRHPGGYNLTKFGPEGTIWEVWATRQALGLYHVLITRNGVVLFDKELEVSLVPNGGLITDSDMGPEVEGAPRVAQVDLVVWFDGADPGGGTGTAPTTMPAPTSQPWGTGGWSEGDAGLPGQFWGKFRGTKSENVADDFILVFDAILPTNWERLEFAIADWSFDATDWLGDSDGIKTLIRDLVAAFEDWRENRVPVLFTFLRIVCTFVILLGVVLLIWQWIQWAFGSRLYQST